MGQKKGGVLGCLPTAYYGASPDDAEKQVLISQQRIKSKILGLWINNYLTTETKIKLRYFIYSYKFNSQDDGDAMFFVVVKILCPDTRDEFSDIKTKLETMKMSQFNHDISKSNLCIVEWTNEISKSR